MVGGVVGAATTRAGRAGEPGGDIWAGIGGGGLGTNEKIMNGVLRARNEVRNFRMELRKSRD
tara:strand:+ start:176 stop:361 length:186 start_codon:yes stop_codon:yes gene_type:complete